MSISMTHSENAMSRWMSMSWRERKDKDKGEREGRRGLKGMVPLELKKWRQPT